MPSSTIPYQTQLVDLTEARETKQKLGRKLNWQKAYFKQNDTNNLKAWLNFNQAGKQKLTGR